MNEKKNAIEGVNVRFDQAEERTCELKDRSFEATQFEEQKDKRIKKNWIPSKKQHMYYGRSRRRREEERITSLLEK